MWSHTQYNPEWVIESPIMAQYYCHLTELTIYIALLAASTSTSSLEFTVLSYGLLVILLLVIFLSLFAIRRWGDECRCYTILVPEREKTVTILL